MANEYNHMDGLQSNIALSEQRRSEQEEAQTSRDKAEQDWLDYATGRSGEPLDPVRTQQFKDSVPPHQFERALYNLQESTFPVGESIGSAILDEHAGDNPNAFRNYENFDNKEINIAWANRNPYHYGIFSGSSRQDYANIDDETYEVMGAAGYISELYGIDIEEVTKNQDLYFGKYASANNLDDAELPTVFDHMRGTVMDQGDAMKKDEQFWSEGIDWALSGLPIPKMTKDNKRQVEVMRMAADHIYGNYKDNIIKAREILNLADTTGSAIGEKAKGKSPFLLGWGGGVPDAWRKKGDGSKSTLSKMDVRRNLAEMLMEESPEDQEQIMSFVFKLTDMEGELVEGSVNRIFQAFTGAVNASVEDILSGLEDRGGDAAINELFLPKSMELSDDKIRARQERSLGLRQALRRAESNYKKIEAQGTGEMIAQTTAANIHYMGMFALGWAGMGAMWLDMSSKSDEQYRLQYPDMNPDERWRMSVQDGLFDMFVEKAKFTAIWGGFPSLTKMIGGSGVMRGLGVFGVRAGAANIAQYGEEAVQGMSNSVLQHIWHTVGADVEAVAQEDWDANFWMYKEDGEKVPFWDGELFTSLLGLSVLMAGGRGVYDKFGGKAVKQMLNDVDKLMMQGYSKVEAEEIVTINKTNTVKAFETFQDGLADKSKTERRENMNKAKAEGAGRRILEKEVLEKKKDVEENGSAEEKRDWAIKETQYKFAMKYDAHLEEREDGKFELVSPTSETAPSEIFDTKEEADEAMLQHYNRVDRAWLGNLAEQIDRVEAMTEQESSEAMKLAVEEIKKQHAKAGVEADIRLDQDIPSMTEFAARGAAEMKVALERVQHELLRKEILRPATVEDFENWVVNAQVQLKKDGRGYIERIAKGGNISDVYEDASEGFLGMAIHNNVVDKGWVKEQLFAYQRDSGDSSNWGFESAEQISDLRMKEAFSDLAVANLWNAANDNKVGKLSGIIRALKHFFKSVMNAAENLLKLQADGKIDTDFQILLDKSVGLDMDEQIKRQTTEAQKEILDEFSQSIELYVAPVRFDNLSSVEVAEIKKRFKASKFSHLSRLATETSEAFGIPIEVAEEVVGGWTEKMDNGELVQSLEVPLKVVFDTNDFDQVVEMAAVLGASAPELQNGVFVWEDDAAGDNVMLQANIGKGKKATAVVKAYSDISPDSGFTYDQREGTLSVAITTDTAKPAESIERFNKFIDEQSKAKNIQEQVPIQRRGTGYFQGGQRYRSVVQEIREHISDYGGTESKKLAVLERAERRIDKYDAAAKVAKNAKETLSGIKEDKLSTSSILSEVKKLPDFKENKKFENIREFGVWQDARFKKIHKVSSFENGSEKGLKIASKAMTYDVLLGLETDGSGVGWYDERLREMMLEMEAIHPELKTDVAAQAMLISIMAATSQGYTVVSNFEVADAVYAAYKKLGYIPENIKYAEANQQINNNFKMINSLIKENGMDWYIDMMDMEVTGGWLRDNVRWWQDKKTGKLKPPSGVTLSQTVRGNRILGEKIGSFFNNMRGRFDTITMDLWYTRTMNRYLGETVIQLTDPKMKGYFERFQSAWEEGKKTHGRTYGLTKADFKSPKKTFDAAKKVFNRWASDNNPYAPDSPYSKFADSMDLEHLARSIHHNGSMKGAPANKSQRTYFAEVLRKSQAELKEMGYDLTEADMQAVLWYAEKRLFAEAGVASNASKPADYLDAAMVLKNKLGTGVWATKVNKMLADVEASMSSSSMSIAPNMEEGKPVANGTVAEKLWSEGKVFYAYHEQDETFSKVTSNEMLNKYDSESLLWFEPETSFSISPATDALLDKMADLARDPEMRMQIYKKMAEKVKQAQAALAAGDDQTTDAIVTNMKTIEAIVSVLPMEIRYKAGRAAQMTKFKTVEQGMKYLTKRLDRVDSLIEEYLVKDLDKRVRRAIRVSQPAGRYKSGATGQSKIGDEARTIVSEDGEIDFRYIGHRIAKAAAKAIIKNPQQAQAAAAEERAKIDEDTTADKQQEYEDVAYTYELFADMKNADSNRLQMMLDLLKTNWDEGRKGWRRELGLRKDWKVTRKNAIMKGLLGKEYYKDDGESARGENLKSGWVRNVARETTSIYHMLDFLREDMMGTPAAKFLKEMVDDLRRASNKFDMEQINHRSMMKKAFSDIFQFKGTNKTARVQARIHGMSKGVEWGDKVTYSVMYDHEITANRKQMEAAYDELAANEDQQTVFLRDQEVTRAEFDEIYSEYLANFDLDVLEGFDMPSERKVFKHSVRRETGKRQSVGLMSQLDLLKDWLSVQQSDIKMRYEQSGYDEKYREQLNNVLDEDTKRMGLWMQDILRQGTPATEALHRSEYGLAMATVMNYFPAVFKHKFSSNDTRLQIEGVDVAGVSKRPSAHMMRVNHKSSPQRQNAVNTFNHHLMQNAFWMTHAEVLRKWGGLLRDPQMQDVILRTKGRGFLKNLNDTFDNLEDQGAKVAQAQIESDVFWRQVGKGLSLGVLGLKISSTFKNALAGANVLYTRDWKDLAKTITSGELIEAGKELYASDTFKRRLEMGASVATRYAMQASVSSNIVFATSTRMAELGIQPINIMDTGTNLTMAMAYVAEKQSLRKANPKMSEAKIKAQALDYVDDMMARYAQPADRMSKSLLENTRPVLGKFLVLFQSEARKYLVINALAARKILTGKGVQSRSLAAQQMLVSNLVVTGGLHLIESAFSALFRSYGEGDDPEEKFLNELFDGKKFAAALIADQLAGVPIFGSAWTMGVNKLMGEKVFTSTSNPMVRSIGGAATLLTSVAKMDENSASENADIILKSFQSFFAMMPQTAVIAQSSNVARDALGLLNNTFFQGLTEADTLELTTKRLRKSASDVSARFKDEKKAATEAEDDYLLDQINEEMREEKIQRAYDILFELPKPKRTKYLKLQDEMEKPQIPRYIIDAMIYQ